MEHRGRRGGLGDRWAHEGRFEDTLEPSDRTPLVLERVTRSRLHTLPAEPWTTGESFSGQIVEDWLDGSKVYPNPPLAVRAMPRWPRLVGRISPWTGLGVALAVLVLAVRLAAAGPSGTLPQLLGGGLDAALVLTLALIPASVSLWLPDRSRSAWMVLIGASVWVALPAVAGLVWTLSTRSPGLFDRIGYQASVLVCVAVIAGYLAPIGIVRGLDVRRRHPAQWLDYVTMRGATIAAAACVVTSLTWLPHARISSDPNAGFDPRLLPDAVSGAALPMEVYFLALLAASCFSAVQGLEAQRRLWQFVGAGSAILAVVATYELQSGYLLPGLISSGSTMGWRADIATAIAVWGAGLMLIGFASPVWSTARDAEGPPSVAPEHVFAWGIAAEGDGKPVTMARIVAIAAGWDHALALDENGRVGAWGDNSLGQMDVPVGLAGVKAIAAGNGFSLALRADGTVVAWGDGSFGQTRVPSDLHDVSLVAAGDGVAFAVRADGSLLCWGDETRPAAHLPDRLAGIRALSAGWSHVLALRQDGHVVAWGDNARGQCDLPPELGRVKAISAGRNFSLALRVDGTVLAWGDNGYGQLDVPAGLHDLAAISAGAFHALALGTDGDVTGWGGGGYQPGGAAHPWRLLQFDAIAAGDGFSLGLRAARSIPVQRGDR